MTSSSLNYEELLKVKDYIWFNSESPTCAWHRVRTSRKHMRLSSWVVKSKETASVLILHSLLVGLCPWTRYNFSISHL